MFRSDCRIKIKSVQIKKKCADEVLEKEKVTTISSLRTLSFLILIKQLMLCGCVCVCLYSFVFVCMCASAATLSTCVLVLYVSRTLSFI